MTDQAKVGGSPHGPVRAAIIAGSLVVAACFSAAATFTDQPAQAAETRQER